MDRIGPPGNRCQPTLSRTIRLFLGVALGSFSGFIIALFARLATSGAYVYV